MCAFCVYLRSHSHHLHCWIHKTKGLAANIELLAKYVTYVYSFSDSMVIRVPSANTKVRFSTLGSFHERAERPEPVLPVSLLSESCII